MTTNPKIFWDFCALCSPFGEHTPEYMARDMPSVRVNLETGAGYCQSCGWRSPGPSPRLFDVARDGEEGKDE